MIYCLQVGLLCFVVRYNCKQRLQNHKTPYLSLVFSKSQYVQINFVTPKFYLFIVSFYWFDVIYTFEFVVNATGGKFSAMLVNEIVKRTNQAIEKTRLDKNVSSVLAPIPLSNRHGKCRCKLEKNEVVVRRYTGQSCSLNLPKLT